MKYCWYNYLKDQDFLTEVLSSYLEEYFIKVHSLNWDEEIIQDIQGKVISASINIDGQSSVRRTANLSFLVDEQINEIMKVDNIISINKKVSIEIGYKNNTTRYLEYPIIWFPLGLYVITSASISQSLSGWTISVQLKDKMVLLNGECGGILPASIVFDNYDTIDENGDYIVARPTIYQIITQLVNHWGKQQLGRIIISDLDTKVKKVMKWVGSTPLYYLKNNKDALFLTTNQSQYQNYTENKNYKNLKYSPYQYGQDVGYIYTDFTYPGDLIANVGETVTSILDKIIEVLGNYEYFYDLYGNFIFQQKKNYLNVAQPFYTGTDKNIFTTDIKYALNKNKGKSVFSFNDATIISSYSNTPKYNMIKNDFIIWGLMRKSNQVQIPIRYHLVIDKKPEPGNTYQAIQYTDTTDNLQKWKSPIKVGWNRENQTPDFPEIGNVETFYYFVDDRTAKEKQNNPKTGYTNQGIYCWVKIEDGYYQYQLQKNLKLSEVTTKDWRTQLYFQGVIAQPYGLESNDYYTELKNEWPRIYDIYPNQKLTVVVTTNSQGNNVYQVVDTETQSLKNTTISIKSTNIISVKLANKQITINKKTYDLISMVYNKSSFNKEYVNFPDKLTYFLDFIDSSNPAAISEFDVSNIGRRTYAIDKGPNINCIFQPQLEDVVFIKRDDPNFKNTSKTAFDLRQYCELKGQKCYQLSSNIYNALSIGGQSRSAYEQIRQSLHEYTDYNEDISLQTLPLYFLQPNNRITVYNQRSNIYGDYIINSLSFSITNNSTLTINATKALQRI